MSADLSAIYCGEPTTSAFLKRVGKEYPQPRVNDGRRRLWLRDDLDQSILPPELAAAVLEALGNAGPDGMPVPEIMAATGSNSRGAMDTLLFKMNEAGEIARIKRGIYAARKDAGKIGQKERNDGQATDDITINDDLTNLTDLTGGAAVYAQTVGLGRPS